MLAQVTLGSLLLDGNLVQSGNAYLATNTPVEIGFSRSASESFTPLTVWTGDMSFTSGGSSFTFSGTIDGIEQSAGQVSIAEITGSQTFAVAALTSTGVAISGGSSMGVAGATFVPSAIALIDPTEGDTTDSFVSLQGSLGFAQLPGLSVPVTSPNQVQINPTALAAGLTLNSAAATSVFEAFGLNLTPGSALAPASLAVGYSSDTAEFQISGSVGVASTTPGVFSAAGALGTPDDPGLVINDSGIVTQLTVTISGSLSVAGLGITASVADLELAYINDASSIYNGDFLIDQGTVTIATSAGDTSFAATFGTGSGADANPGLVLDAGSLAGFYATIGSTISAQGLTLNATGLTFQYEGSTSSFIIAPGGSVSISSGPLQFATATFGVSGAPGLEIQDGILTGLDITISTSATVGGMTLSASSLEFLYTAVPGQTDGDFEIATGTVSLNTGPTDNALSFSGTLGTTQDGDTLPGLTISNGVLQSFYISVTSNIMLGSTGGSLTLEAEDLTFTYDSTTNGAFEILNGSVSVSDSNGDFQITGTFGTAATSSSPAVPGLVVSGGALTALDVTVTSSLTAGGLTITVTDLTFAYNAAANQYEIDTGSLSFNTSEGFSFSAAFGLTDPANPATTLPGLVIAGGVLTQFNAALTSSFTVAGLTIGVTDMAMSYSGSNQYAMYGTVSVNTSNVVVTGTIGQPAASPPVYGLIIDDNVLESLAITINSTVTFGSLSLQAQNLAFTYSASPESFTLYGNVTASVAGVTLQGNLGTAALPGLAIVNGQLAALNLGVTADFNLFALQCNVQDLTFQYETENGSTRYVLFGALSLAISGNTISATMGSSAANAGLVIANNVVTQINMTINGSFEISGFGFQIIDANLDYTSTENEYLISGTFTLSNVFSASVQLGTGPSDPGITVLNGVFYLDNFSFDLQNVPIGAFTLNYLTISYASAGDVWSGSASVTFPTGWAIAASMTFVGGVLDDISLSYSAGTSTGIAIPDTGMFVTGISASLENLDQPASIIVSGSIQAVFGKQISIGGTSCAIFAVTGSFTADGQELVINGDYYEGAYQSNGNWNGILGSGSASVTLNWAAGVYSASVSESLYEGIFVISASMSFDDSGDLSIIASATVEVPNSVPFIGGTKLGSMNFAFIYSAANNSGTVAAWINVNCYFTTITTGFEYSFNSGNAQSFQIIGAGGVNSILNQASSISSSNANTPTIYVYTDQVTVAAGSGENGLSVQATWPANLGTQTLLISGPNDNGTFYSATSSSLPSNVDFLTSYTTTTSQSVLTTGSATSTGVPLPAGTYTFQVQSTYEFASASAVTFATQVYYEAPSVAITSVPSQALAFTPAMTGFAAGALAGNTTITLYADSNGSGYQGKQVGSFGYSAVNGVLQNVPIISLADYAPGQSIYIYAIINDGTNSAVYSAYSSAVTPEPDLVGTVTDQFGNPISGIRIFLDLNNNQTYDAPLYNNGVLVSSGDPSQITNASGNFFFNNLLSYSGTDIGYPTFRVMAVMPSPSFTPITPSTDVNSIWFSANAGSSFIANFTIDRLASISGSLYSDLNQDGQYVSSDPPLGGVTVYLDLNGSGTYNSGEPTCVTGPSGTYGFYDLGPGTYTVGVITSTTTGSVTTQSYVVTQPASATYTISITSDAQQLSSYQFGVISLATLSGSVTSQNSSGGTTTPLPGTTVNLSTPNVTAAVPAYSSFSSTAGLNLIGSSVSSTNSLTMLAAGPSSTATSAWYTTRVPVLGGFQATYQWSMSSSGATAGGFAFVVQNSGASATGTSAYGYGGIAPSVAVIFDAVANEILIESGGSTSASNAIQVLFSQQLGFSLASGTVYSARITFLPTSSTGLGTLSVYLNGDSSGGLTPVITASLNLGSLLNLSASNTAYVGFTAGTSSGGLSASIASWSYTALNTRWTTTDSNGNYTFTGLMPKTTYSVSQVAPSGQAQSSPFSTLGIFSQGPLPSPAAVVSSVVSGDFNGDGIPDVAYATSLSAGSPYQIVYAYGNGNGGFAAPVVVTIPVPANSPALATPSNGSAAFNAVLVAGTFGNQSRDEIAYVATMAMGGAVVVIYDIATNSILNLIEIESATVAPTPGATVSAGYAGTINNAAAGDLNNDGYDDLAVSTYGGVFTIVSFQNISSGTIWTVNPTTLAVPLAAPSLLYANGTPGNTSGVSYNAGVVLGDFNQDGILDLATVGVQYIPVASAGFYGPVYSWSSMTVATTIQLAYGTGNGVGYDVQSQLTFQLYSGQNIDLYFSSSSASPTFPLPFGMAAPDLNGDGVPDLVLNGYTDNLQPAVIALLQVNGNFTQAGTFLLPNGKSFNVNSSFGNNVTLPGSSIVAAGVIGMDLNGDGYDDIAAIDPNLGQVMFLTTAGAPWTSGQTQAALQFSGGALPQFVAADYGMDGYPDLIVPGGITGSSQAAPVFILNGTLNTGTISYTPTNGQVFTGANFTDFAFSSGSNSPAAAQPAVSGAIASTGALTPDTVTITGRVFLDRNGNSRYNVGETGLGGMQLYIDSNQNGQFDPSRDPTTVTNAQGFYSFTGLAPGGVYKIGIVNLPAGYEAAEVSVATSRARAAAIVDRYIPVTRLWSLPQAVSAVDPLTPIAINLAPPNPRAALGFWPIYRLVGAVPSGMTINPYTGQILWNVPLASANSTVTVTVLIANRNNPEPLQTQSAQLSIQVNAISDIVAYIRDVYGALLSRLPTAQEIAEWTARLRAGASRLSFVSSLAHSDERYSILTNQVYLNVFGRIPTESQAASAIRLYQSGGNTDQLTRQLLVSTAFIELYPSNKAYVNAVNKILLFRKASPARTRREVAWLRAGRSRTRLINRISRSHAATWAQASRLSYVYLGGLSSRKVLSQWATELSRGTLNSDTLTIRILASQTYADGWSTRQVPNIQAPGSTTSTHYNRLSHLVFEVTGYEASRSQLDSVESQLYDGHSWRSVAKGIYNGPTATEMRIQTQYQNLLHRKATAAELSGLARTLPAANQSQALEVRIMSGSEYRARFSSTTSYVNAVYQVLTGATPPIPTVVTWTNRLDRGLAPSRFVSSISSSAAGRTGQIQRLYWDYLGREPTVAETNQVLSEFPGTELQDRPIALQLVNEDEFRLQERTAQLLAAQASGN